MKQKTGFVSLLTKKELTFGLVYLVLHVFVLPDALYYLLTALFGAKAVTGAWLTFACYLVGAAAVLAFGWRFMRESFYVLWERFTLAIGSFAGGYLIYYFLLYAVSVLITSVAPELTSNPNNDQVAMDYMQNRGVMYAAAVLLAPISEEFLFRGVLFGTLQKRSRVLAYAVSVAAFCLYHLWQLLFTGVNMLAFLLYLLQYLPGAVAMARAYERSGSLWTAIFLHMFINAMALR